MKNIEFVSAYLKDGETCPLCGRERTPITVYGPPKMILNKNESGPSKFQYRIKCNACGRQFHVIYSAVDVEEINPPYVR
jgi:transcription elongation factor Elf1